ncbi:XdhC family protein [Thiohalorhabdus sp. Cl-TMA]|uniref:XdhC family protein n=1 Tax=Thiohalorhabdus methylotrophus TaxID=3242694 RepID=A0ABV4TRH9_9GAMM
MKQDILDVQRALRDSRRPYAVATVVETEGSVSAKTGSKAVIDESGRVVAGWVGGGCAESNTSEQALRCLESGETAVLDIDMNDEVLGAGMPCGGSMRVYVEPVPPAPTLWLVGHGRVAETLSRMAALAGLRVVVNDPQADAERYPDADRLITDDIDYEALQPTADDYVVIATQHKGDHDSMRRALAAGAGYIALIASRKRSNLVLDFLREQGFGEADLGRVYAPAGLDLGARTPEEIAVCVLSEIVLRRRGGTGRPMCAIPGEGKAEKTPRRQTAKKG